MANAHSNLGDHTFGAPPQSWPLMGKTLPYWLDEKSNAQVTLVGNPVLWWVSTGSIHVFLCLTTFYLMRRQRQCADIDAGGCLGGGGQGRSDDVMMMSCPPHIHTQRSSVTG